MTANIRNNKIKWQMYATLAHTLAYNAAFECEAILGYTLAMPTKKPIGAVETVPLEKLMLDPANARLHNVQNIDALKSSLTSFDQPEPVIVRRADNVVISGNGRLQAMRELGWTTAQVIYVDWPEDKARAYSLAANRTAELAEWDNVVLQDHIAALDGTEFDVADFGFADFVMPEMGDSQEGTPDNGEPKPKQGRPVQLTQEQRTIFDQACTLLRGNHGEDVSEGRALELMSADYLAGA